MGEEKVMLWGEGGGGRQEYIFYGRRPWIFSFCDGLPPKQEPDGWVSPSLSNFRLNDLVWFSCISSAPELRLQCLLGLSN